MSRRERFPPTVAIVDLRPTQITVGYREVERKRGRFRDRAKLGGSRLSKYSIPVVRGPRNQLFILDHHHMARALLEEGVDEVAVSLVADLGALSMEEFWAACDRRGWGHPYDAAGERRATSAIPLTISDLADDPFRSLAGELRRAGGFAKAPTPYSEFRWADFLRRRIDRAAVEGDLDRALEIALNLARRPEAEQLPGWRRTTEHGAGA